MVQKVGPVMALNKTQLRILVAESHRRQFNGEDFQVVAVDIAQRNGIVYEDGAYTELQSSPNPGCDCGFCATAPWE